MPGTLFVVATPIGNLEDITLRALRTLREVDTIAAEDTRRTARLLAHFDIRRPLVSVREHNETREGRRLVERMLTGESVALVTDAGTPGISDPGARFVAAAREATVGVVPIPGPSAITTALSVAGLALGRFTFAGFPPSTGRSREEWFERLLNDPGAIVLFESPHRIGRTIDQLSEIMSNRRIYVFRELTKINEELVISPITAGAVQSRGEFTLVIGPHDDESGQRPSDAEIGDMFDHLTVGPGLDPELARTVVARYFGVSDRLVRSTVKKQRILAKRQKDASP